MEGRKAANSDKGHKIRPIHVTYQQNLNRNLNKCVSIDHHKNQVELF